MDEPTVARLQRTTDKVGQIVFLEMTCDAWPEPVRIVNSTEAKVMAGVEYIALPFYFKLPDRRQEGSARAQLAIDNVGRNMAEYLEQIEPGQTVMCRIIVAHNDDQFRIIHQSFLPGSNITMDQMMVTIDCSIAFVTNQKTMKLRATPFLTPGIF
jgi:hypothetical protein